MTEQQECLSPAGAANDPASRERSRVLVYVIVGVWIVWVIGMVAGNRWGYFEDSWFMSVTMVVGSFIAGATSEGGGAIAFPVMTLAFHVPPQTARDFALLIQSVGMSAAAITILARRIDFSRRAVGFAGFGGALGMIVGLEFLQHRLPPAYAKLLFTSTWAAFAVALYLMNRNQQRITRRSLPTTTGGLAAVLVAAGFVGGAISSVAGSGADIALFSLLVLLWRIDERVATPTSVVLMALLSIVGATWRGAVQHQLADQAIRFWWVCVPVVVVGAPLGALFIRHRSRRFVVGILYVSIVAQSVAALILIPLTPQLALLSIGIFTLGVATFVLLDALGRRRL